MFKRYHLRFDSNEKLTVRVRLSAFFTDHIVVLISIFFALLFVNPTIESLMKDQFHGASVTLVISSLFLWGACYILVMDIRPQKYWETHTFSRINYKINGQLVANREDINVIHILQSPISLPEGDFYTYTLSIKHHHNQKQIIDVPLHDALALFELADTIADVLDVKIVYEKVTD